MTIFEDHMIRDINAGRFRDNTSLVLLTHGLALRVFLMRWFHWTVDQFMNVYNPPNAEVRACIMSLAKSKAQDSSMAALCCSIAGCASTCHHTCKPELDSVRWLCKQSCVHDGLQGVLS